MAKSSQDAVADVLGDDSPVLARLAKSATTPKKPPTQTATEAPEASPTARPAPQPRKIVQSSTAVSTARSKDKAKRTKVSPEEEQTIDDLVMRLGRAMGSKVQFSHISRAMWALLLEAEDGLGRVSPPNIQRPPNSDPVAMADYEDAIAGYLLEVFHTLKKR